VILAGFSSALKRFSQLSHLNHVNARAIFSELSPFQSHSEQPYNLNWACGWGHPFISESNGSARTPSDARIAAECWDLAAAALAVAACANNPSPWSPITGYPA
jgi:hypothetical protein